MTDDEELTAAGLSVLEDLAAVLLETAHEAAVHIAPADRRERLARLTELRRTGTDLVVIVDACKVLIRRGGGARSGDESAEVPSL